MAWSPTDRLSIIVSGLSFGIEPSEGNISVVNAPGGPVGDEEAFIDFSDTGMLNIEYNLGATILGMALLDICVPECGYELDAASAETIHPDTELMTVVMHLRGSIALLSYNAYAAASSGTFSASSKDGAGSGGGVGLVFQSGGFRAAMDYSQITVECNLDAGGAICTDDNEQTRWGVAVNLGGFGAHYYFGEDETGTEAEKTANIDAVYLVELGDAVVGPEYRTTSIENPDGTESTDSFLLFGMSLEF